MEQRIILLMVGPGARKNTKSIITSGLGDAKTEKVKGGRGYVCVVLIL